MSDSLKYSKVSQIEHILLRPDSYVGEIDSSENEMYVYSKDENKIIKKKIMSSPGLVKLFDEILVNSRDATVNDESSNEIKIFFDADKNEISVYNNGDDKAVIPVEQHPKELILTPTLIFGSLLTSSNYNDEEKKQVGGKNGYGAKLANIYSNKFIVEINDAKRKKHFIQEWSNNMSIANNPEVNKLNKGVKSSVKITFYPDLKRFKLKKLDDDYKQLFHRRLIDIAGTSNRKLNVYFNDEKIKVNNFKDYISLYYSEDEIYYDDSNEYWKIGIIYKQDNGGEVVSFVNGIATYNGGTHCNYVIDNIIKILINDYIKKKDKNIKVNANLLKENLIFFINSVIINPSFSSQTKETLTTKADKFEYKYEPNQIFLKKFAKCGIVEKVIELAKFKENSSLKKTDGKKQDKITGIPKLDDANKAGTKESSKCTLILTEGDSAKATAMAGISIVGRDYYGVFPLKGKILNVRDAAANKILENEEITNLKKILGLKQGVDYEDEKHFNTLRYGHIMIFTDSDCDGSHIKGLFINMIHSMWPSLVKQKDFIQTLNTPIVKAFAKKGNKVEIFYNLTDYEKWKQVSDAKKYDIKYYKGLGTSTSVEAREYFVDIGNKIISYEWNDTNSLSDKSQDLENDEKEPNFIKKDDNDAITLAFDKSRANDRKKWLMQYDKNKIITYEQKKIPYYDFIHYDLIHFSNEDLVRSIPSIIDGLKPSQRKILYGAFLRGLDKTEVKVAQLAGFVSDRAAYHHGEMSLNGAIIGMAQDFVGSNNINILKPNGQFGCLAPGTSILMWDGSIKSADSIEIGDQLVGDDGLVRNVIAITSGIDDMYEITTNKGHIYIVNSEHIITVYDNMFKKEIDIELTYYINLPNELQKVYTMISKEPIYNNKILMCDYNLQFKIKHIGKGPFNGWSLDGNERFLLGNYIVTHNSRLKGGSDSASPRYIWTKLELLSSIIFNPIDDAILNKQYEDGNEIEPEFYAPIIPMILVNGADGIGTGFSTSIPPYNPLDIINNLKSLLEGKKMSKMNPWWQGFKGDIKKLDEKNYELYGKWIVDDNANKIIVTELPVGEWTGNYKEHLEKLLSLKKEEKNNGLQSYKDNNTDTQVYFELIFDDIDIKDLGKKFHLVKKYSITNMHLYSPEGHIKKYNTVFDIINEYYQVRLKLYNKRKEHLLLILKQELLLISNKIKFILLVVNKKIEINNKKKQDIEEKLEEHKLPKINDSYDYLLNMPIYSLTNEKIEELKQKETNKETEYNDIENKTIEAMWLEELILLENKYNEWIITKNTEHNKIPSKKNKKK